MKQIYPFVLVGRLLLAIMLLLCFVCSSYAQTGPTIMVQGITHSFCAGNEIQTYESPSFADSYIWRSGNDEVFEFGQRVTIDWNTIPLPTTLTVDHFREVSSGGEPCPPNQLCPVNPDLDEGGTTMEFTHSITITVTRRPLPTMQGATIITPPSVKVNCDQPYSVSGITLTDGDTFVWHTSAGGTIKANSGNSAVISFTSGQSAMVTVWIQSASCGLSAPISTPSMTIQYPGAPVSISGPTAVCPNGEASFTAIGGGGGSYEWTYPAGAVITGNGTPNVQIKFGTTAGPVTAFVKNECNYDTPKATLFVGISPAPSAPIRATPSWEELLCPGKPVELGVVYNTGSTYEWTVSGPASFVVNGVNMTSVIGNASAPSPLVTLLPHTAGTGTIQVSVLQRSSCGPSLATEQTFGLISAPTIQGPISGDIYFCPGKVQRYEVPATAGNGLQYQWTFPAGITDVKYNTLNQSSVDVTIPAGNTFTGGTITVKASNGCQTSAALSKAISKRPDKLPEISLAGPNIHKDLQKSLVVFSCVENTCLPKQLKRAVLRARLDFGDTYQGEMKDAYSAQVQIRFRSYRQGVADGAIDEPVSLDVSPGAPEQLFSLDITHAFATTEIIQAEITGYTAPGQEALPSLRLVLGYEEEFAYEMADQKVALAPADQNTTAKSGKFEQDFYWGPPCVPLSTYQFQLIKVQAGASLTTWSKEEERNALLLDITDANLAGPYFHYKLSIVEGSGDYKWRIRPVGNLAGAEANPANWGEWSSTATFYYTQHEEDKNWIYSRTFTEGNRASEQLAFANGLQQLRQTQTRNASQNRIVATQTLQDYSGRDAVQSLPIPLTPTHRLGFQPNLLSADSEKQVPYGPAQFDAASTYKLPVGAYDNGYYQTAQTNSESLENAGVADAGQYPYTRTRFAADGTNRVVEQSGVGVHHNISSGKTVRTYYSSVAEAELVRLFGKEAPLPSKVHKIITTDPNNTTSVTYKSEDGKVIATALSVATGSASLVPLDSRVDASLISERILDTAPYNGTGSSSKKHLQFPTDTDLTITYTYAAAKLDIKTQFSTEPCHTCDHKVEVILHNQEDPSQSQVFNVALISASGPIPPTFTITIPGGLKGGVPYLLEKRVTALLEVTPGSKTTYLDQYLAEVEATHNTHLQQGIWPEIQSYLANNQLKELYALLDNTGLQRILNPATQEEYYEVVLGAVPAQTLIRIPYLKDGLEETPVTCTIASTDFEQYFNEKWGEVYSLAQELPGYTPGSLNAMMVKILNDAAYQNADPDYNLTCEFMLNCWKSVVLTYEDIRGQALVPGSPPALLKSFWECIGIRPYKVYMAGSTPHIFEEQYAYQLFDYSKQADKSCWEAVYKMKNPSANTVPAPAIPAPTVNDLDNLSLEHGKLLAGCVQSGAVLAGAGVTPPATQPSDESKTKEVNDALKSVCESLRGAFEDAVVASLHEQGTYVEGDLYLLEQDPVTGKHFVSGSLIQDSVFTPSSIVSLCDVQNTVDQLVLRCESNTTLTMAVDPNTGLKSLGTATDFERLRSITLASFELSVGASNPGNFQASEFIPAVAANPQQVAVEQVKTLLANNFANTLYDDVTWNVQKDNSGNIYVFGQVPKKETAIPLGDGNNTLVKLQGPCSDCVRYRDFFIVKFNASGVYQWDRYHQVQDATTGTRMDAVQARAMFNLDKKTGEIFFSNVFSGGLSTSIAVTERKGSLVNGVYQTTLGQSVTVTHGLNGYLGRYTATGDLTIPLNLVGAWHSKPLMVVTMSTGETVFNNQYSQNFSLKGIKAGVPYTYWNTPEETAQEVTGLGEVLDLAIDGSDQIYVLAQVKSNQVQYYRNSTDANGNIVQTSTVASLSQGATSGYALIQYAPDKTVRWVKLLESDRTLAEENKEIRLISTGNSVVVAFYTTTQEKTITLASQHQVRKNEVLFAEYTGDGDLNWSETYSLGNVNIRNLSALNAVDDHLYFVFKLASQQDLPILKIHKGTKEITQETISNPNGTIHDIRSIYPVGGQYELIGRAAGTGPLVFGGTTIPRLGTTYTEHVFLASYDPDSCARTSGSLAVYLKWKPVTSEITVDPAFVADFTPQPVAHLQMGIVRNAVEAQLASWLAIKQEEYRKSYMRTCTVLDQLQDNLTIYYELGYHHFTLYYYDRAGNLQRTIPPAGVVQLGVSDTELPVSRTSATKHFLETRYQYNSLGQLIAQHTPDAGTTTFYYNKAGQLRYSQNAEQKGRNAYSYTKYDNLGRVLEVGESTSQGALVTVAEQEVGGFTLKTTDDTFPTEGKRQVTTTVYSEQHRYTKTPTSVGTDVSYLDGKKQQHLLNRVSYTYLDADGSNTTLDDRTLTYYSYDPHGNVEWLVQEIQGLGRKYIRYEYDLISGKVLRVNYQEGREDQFFHKYDYDPDNRLTAVYTSADGNIWDRDAAYQYYAHGPLRRMELGEDYVQGVDYTYTIQGWLKAINHPDMTVANDLGKDGAIASTNTIPTARDAFGMVLNYYSEDYLNANSPLNSGSLANAYLFADAKPLYNGNIAAWGTGNFYRTYLGNILTREVVSEHFQYDELNRIKESSFFNVTGSNATHVDAFKTNYSYDPNGNLQTLLRHNIAGGQMDSLSYKYQWFDPVTGVPTTDKVNRRLKDNKLRHVRDLTGDIAYANDVDNQAANNYAYDAAGNLVQDVEAGITDIDWTPYGKVERITKTGSAVTFGYDASGNRVLKMFGDKTTYYVRDASGNVMATYALAPPANSTTPELRLKEQPIYGSARVGQRTPNILIANDPSTGNLFTRNLGDKLYELNDHLGNIRAVISDKKQSFSAGAYEPLIIEAKAYYPFGQEHEERFAGLGTVKRGHGYRYGFNGKEKDESGEWGEVTNYDYGFRIYNSGIARFLSVDPLAPNYPFYTPYQFAGNKPIMFVDVDGLEEGYNISFERMQKGYVNGIYTEKQLREFNTATGLGAAMGVGVLLTQGAILRYGPRLALWAMGSSRLVSTSISASLASQRYGGDVGNFVYGVLSDDPTEPFPSTSGAQFSDAGVSFRRLIKNKSVVLDFFGGAKSKYTNGISIDPEAKFGFKGTINQFSEIFKGTKVDKIVADNPYNYADYLVDASELLNSGGTITVRGSLNNKFFNQILKGTANGLEHFEVIKQAAKVSDEVKSSMKLSDGVTPIKSDVYETILKRK